MGTWTPVWPGVPVRDLVARATGRGGSAADADPSGSAGEPADAEIGAPGGMDSGPVSEREGSAEDLSGDEGYVDDGYEDEYYDDDEYDEDYEDEPVAADGTYDDDGYDDGYADGTDPAAEEDAYVEGTDVEDEAGRTGGSVAADGDRRHDRIGPAADGDRGSDGPGSGDDGSGGDGAGSGGRGRSSALVAAALGLLVAALLVAGIIAAVSGTDDATALPDEVLGSEQVESDQLEEVSDAVAEMFAAQEGLEDAEAAFYGPSEDERRVFAVRASRSDDVENARTARDGAERALRDIYLGVSDFTGATPPGRSARPCAEVMIPDSGPSTVCVYADDESVTAFTLFGVPNAQATGQVAEVADDLGGQPEEAQEG